MNRTVTALAASALALLLSVPCQAYDDYPPHYAATGDPATNIHGHSPDTGADMNVYIYDTYNDAVIDGTRFQAWIYDKTLDFYRIDSYLVPCGWHDLDRCQNYDYYLGQYGPWYPIQDFSVGSMNLYKWNNASQPYYFVPTGEGAITYTVRWYDDNNPEGTYDSYVEAWAGVSVLNNCQPGGSSILVNGTDYLCYRELKTDQAVPYLDEPLNRGKFHIKINESMFLTEGRNVQNFKVDLFNGTSTSLLVPSWSYATSDDARHYQYAPVENPLQYHDVFRPTQLAGYYRHERDHAGLPHMLTPKHDYPIVGGICVVDAVVWFDIGCEVPRKPGDPPVTVHYNAEPRQHDGQVSPDDPQPWLSLAPTPEIRVEIRDPTPDPEFVYKKVFILENISGTFEWDGLLDKIRKSDEIIVQLNARYCLASTPFKSFAFNVEDELYNGANRVVYYPAKQLTFLMPDISIVDPPYGSAHATGATVTFQLAKSETVVPPLSEATWTGGGTPETGTGQTFITVLASQAAEKHVVATLSYEGRDYYSQSTGQGEGGVPRRANTYWI